MPNHTVIASPASSLTGLQKALPPRGLQKALSLRGHEVPEAISKQGLLRFARNDKDAASPPRNDRLFVIILLFIFSSCASQPYKIVTPEGPLPKVVWNEGEKKQALAIRKLSMTENASYHLIRLKGAERPHVHDRHDLTVFVLAGRGKVHLKGRSFSITEGDVIDIPRGTPHWAKSSGSEAVQAYAVFTPPYDGTDHRELY